MDSTLAPTPKNHWKKNMATVTNSIKSHTETNPNNKGHLPALQTISGVVEMWLIMHQLVSPDETSPVAKLCSWNGK